MLKIPFLALAGLVCWAVPPAPACPVCLKFQQQVRKSVVLEIHGKLTASFLEGRPRRNVFPDDGSITAGGKTYRLRFQSQELRLLGHKLHGQRVVLTGRLERWAPLRLLPLPVPEPLPLPSFPEPYDPIVEVEVVVVTGLRADDTGFVRETCHVEIQGKLRRVQLRTTEPNSPTYTLWTIEAGGQTYQLDLVTRHDFLRASRMEGLTVVVTGTLGNTAGLLGQRVTVTDITDLIPAKQG
jgi:hypothetical protein